MVISIGSRRRLLVPAAFLLFCVAAGQPAAQERKPADAVRVAPPGGEEAQMLRIERLELDPGKHLPGIGRVATRPIHEVINPFTARKRSRVYGSLYEYHRNDNFDARNFFDPVGRKLPEYKRNQFGATMGLFATDRLTLFGTYDGLRINRGSTLLSHVPTAAMKKGDFGLLGLRLRNPWTGEPFAANRIPESLWHPVAVKLLAVLPDPNRDDPARNFVNNRPFINDRDTLTARVDYKFGEENKLFANYSLAASRGFEVQPLPLFGMQSRGREQDFSLSMVRQLGPKLVASMQFQFSREARTELAPQAGMKGLLASLGIAGVSVLDDLDEGYPDIGIAGYVPIGSGDSPTASYYNQFELNLDVGYVHKNHAFEFGVEFERAQINNDRTGGLRRGSFEFDGSFTGDAFADFLLGVPSAAERGVGSDRADLRRGRWRAFVRDNWKVNRKFSLSAALAYNYTPFAHSIHDNVYAFAPLLFDPPLTGRIVRLGSEEAARSGLAGLRSGHAVYPDRNDWEPMLGLAYSPQGNNRLVVRASYRLTHEARDMDESFEVLGRSYPAYYREKAESSGEQPDIDLSNPFAAAAPVELRIQGVEPHFRNSVTHQWQLLVQNEIYPRWNLEVVYTGRARNHEDRTIVANVPPPGPGPLQSRRPNPNFGRFGILSADGSSFSNSMLAALRKRLSRGFSAEAAYTWSRTIAYGAGEPNNPRNLRAERAPSSSAPHQFTLNFICDVPVGRGRAVSTAWAGRLGRLFEGWRVSGIASYRSGNLFHPRLAGDPNNDGVRGDRPDRTGAGNLPKAERSIDRWFDTGAFRAPERYAFGNCGRNILTGPGRRNWDLSFVKRTQVSRDGDVLELRIQLFNALNHANFTIPNTTAGTSVFGKIFGAERAREIEIAVKYTF